MRRLALLALIITLPLSAQKHPNLERGVLPEKMYQFGDLDTVNLFNGNMTIALPMGQRYPVGGSLDYGLTLVYNSKVWDNFGKMMDEFKLNNMEIHEYRATH